uniref:Uncharacterized protein n=1 Tax=Romanomermis culicivorax TaxID=13658 RepID=A0A915KEQ5_ROMCU
MKKIVAARSFTENEDKSHLSEFKFSPIAQGSHAGQGHKRTIADVVTTASLIFRCVGFDDLIVVPQMGDGHTILSQCSRFVRTDGARGTQSLNGLQMFDQTIFAGHTFGGQIHGQRNDEKRNAQENCDAGNQMNKVGDFAGYGRFARLQTGSQMGDSTHNGTISRNLKFLINLRYEVEKIGYQKLLQFYRKKSLINSISLMILITQSWLKFFRTNR